MKIVSVIWEDCHDGQLKRDTRMILLNAKAHFASFRKFNPDAELVLVSINCNYSFPDVTTMRITMPQWNCAYARIYGALAELELTNVVYTDLDTFQVKPFDFRRLYKTGISFQNSIDSGSHDLTTQSVSWIADESYLNRVITNFNLPYSGSISEHWDKAVFDSQRAHGYRFADDIGVCFECTRQNAEANYFVGNDIDRAVEESWLTPKANRYYKSLQNAILHKSGFKVHR